MALTLDFLLKLRLPKLKNAIRPGDLFDLTSNWYREGKIIASAYMSVTVNPGQNEGFINLTYFNSQGKPIQYVVRLVQLPSNLKADCGGSWYFVCPSSGQRCRVLYLWHDYFVSRKALPNILYEAQTKSKSQRAFSQGFAPIFAFDQVRPWLDKPHAKKHYRGNPTPMMRKFLRHFRAVQECIRRKSERVAFLQSQIDNMS